MSSVNKLRRLHLGLVVGILTCCLAALAAHDVLKPAISGVTDRAAAAVTPQMQQVATADAGFGFRLLSTLVKSTPGSNVFISPLSISMALEMTMGGAGGHTQRVMCKALGLASLSENQIDHANSSLLSSLTFPDPKVDMSVANALWADKSITVAPAFQNQCRQYYNAPAETLDFRSPSAATAINAWVSSSTHGEISRIVSPADLYQAQTALTDAVYFHGQWSSAFDKSATRNGSFTLANGDVKTVPLMAKEETLRYMETPQFQAVCIPYGTGRVSFYVFLPKPGVKLSSVLANLNPGSWNNAINRMRPTSVSLALPRFTAQSDLKLKAPLSALGMGSVFGPGADFRPMGLTKGFVGDILHKSLVDVDEQGTVAAAATGVVMQTASIGIFKSMRIDHPFFCAIRDSQTGVVLFEGAIEDPS